MAYTISKPKDYIYYNGSTTDDVHYSGDTVKLIKRQGLPNSAWDAATVTPVGTVGLKDTFTICFCNKYMYSSDLADITAAHSNDTSIGSDTSTTGKTWFDTSGWSWGKLYGNYTPYHFWFSGYVLIQGPMREFVNGQWYDINEKKCCFSKAVSIHVPQEDNVSDREQECATVDLCEMTFKPRAGNTADDNNWSKYWTADIGIGLLDAYDSSERLWGFIMNFYLKNLNKRNITPANSQKYTITVEFTQWFVTGDGDPNFE